MVNTAFFATVRTSLEKSDAAREGIIRASRDALLASKAAIYAVHKDDTAHAKEHLAQARKSLQAVAASLKKHADLDVGAVHEAMEEFAEASCYYGIMVDDALPTPEELDVDLDAYLGGLCDCVGELVRKAVNAVLDNKEKEALAIRATVKAVYDELTQIEWRNTPVRRKFDSIKYGLEKLDDLALKLKLDRGLR